MKNKKKMMIILITTILILCIIVIVKIKSKEKAKNEITNKQELELNVKPDNEPNTNVLNQLLNSMNKIQEL